MEPSNETSNNNATIKPAKKSVLPVILTALIVLLLCAGAFGFYKLNEDRQIARDDVAKLEAEIKQLKEKLTTNNQNNDDKDNKGNKELTEAEKIAAVKKALEAAFTARDNTKMVELMADKVTVVLAASEGVPPQTPENAVSGLLDYMKNAGNWSFSLSEAEVAKYKQGDYKQYLADSFSLGKSEKGYVVSFSINEQHKVNQIFMRVSADLL